MQDSTTKTAAGGRLPTFGPDTIETLMRARVRTTIEAIVQEELDAALGAAKSARVSETRQGYRHGSRERTLTTSLGPATIPMPRARIQAADGTTAEWRSAPVTRYQRRTVRVDEMILGVGIVKLTKSPSIDPQDTELQPVANPPCWASKTTASLNLTVPDWILRRLRDVVRVRLAGRCRQRQYVVEREDVQVVQP